MVAAWPLPLLLLCRFVVGSGGRDLEEHERCGSSGCKLEDELSLLQIQSDSVKRGWTIAQAEEARRKMDEEDGPPDPSAQQKSQLSDLMKKYFPGGKDQADEAKADTMILVQWKLNMNNRKESKYLFFKNRWWPWFSSLFSKMPVVLHIGGTNLRYDSVQLSNGQLSGSMQDLFAGDSVHINSKGGNTPTTMKMKEFHRCVNPGLVGDLVFLQNPDHEECPNCPQFDQSGSSCTQMYNNTNITRFPHTAKFGDYRFVALNSGFTTELASRMFRAAVTGVMNKDPDHTHDIILGSWNVDPTDKPLSHIYGGYPKAMEGVLKSGMSSHKGKPSIVFARGPDGSMMTPTCKNCTGKPASEQVTDYAIAGSGVKMVALPSFKDQVMYDTWTALATSNVLSPPTVASSNYFPGQNSSDGVHVPLVYAIEFT